MNPGVAMLEAAHQAMRTVVGKLYLEDICRFVRSHGNAAWVLDGVVIIESHLTRPGQSNGASTDYAAVTTVAQARSVLGY